MPPAKRTRRFLGLTSKQLTILLLVLGLNCLIFGTAAVMFSNLAGNDSPATGKSPAISLTVQTTLAAGRFPPTWTPTPTNIPLTPKSSPTATPTAIASPTSEKPIIADWEMLNSYRLQLKMQQASSDAADQFIQWKVDYKRSKPLSAAHLVISMDGPGRSRMAAPWDTEKIAIGTTLWIKFGDYWLYEKYPQAPSLLGKWEGLERKFRQLQFVNEEAIGGILCRRYRIDEYMTSGMDFLSQRLKATMHAQGDLWIVHQPDLPAVAIRLWLHMQPKGLDSMPSPTNESQPAKPEQSALVYDVEYEVTDINAPITINPPGDSHQPQVVMTDTPLPDNSAQPGSAQRPTSTPSPDQLRRQMTALLWEDGAPGVIEFFDYFQNPRGQGLLLAIQARCINVPCDANFIARVLEAFASLIKSGVKFEATTVELEIAIGDGRTAKWGVLRASWQDVVDFAYGRITFEELTRKAFDYLIE